MSAEHIGSRINGDNIELLAREHSILHSGRSSLRAQSICDSKDYHGTGKEIENVDGIHDFGFEKNLKEGKDQANLDSLVYFSYSCECYILSFAWRRRSNRGPSCVAIPP